MTDCQNDNNDNNDRTVLTDIHIQHNRPDIIILNKQQKQAYLLDIAVPNSHNITQTYRVSQNWLPREKRELRANILTCILKKKSPISNDNREKTF
jgi:hypothetical protein